MHSKIYNYRRDIVSKNDEKKVGKCEYERKLKNDLLNISRSQKWTFLSFSIQFSIVAICIVKYSSVLTQAEVQVLDAHPESQTSSLWMNTTTTTK